MRNKNPELMKNICAYTNYCYRDNHHAPTQREIADAMSISLATVNRYLTAMAEKGMIGLDNGKARSTAQISFMIAFISDAEKEKGESASVVSQPIGYLKAMASGRSTYG